jgi:cellulose synthase/poly-beta-1,6-N-acetylglucosamine synthase-like glycosyltransferase
MKVSIIIPTYNRPKWCREAVGSALSQEGDNEIIVCNDGGEPVDLGDVPVRYFDWPLTNGTATVNRAIREVATGELITVLHDDDHFSDSKAVISRARYFEMLEGSGLDFVYSSWRIMYSTGRPGEVFPAGPVDVSRLAKEEYVNCVTMMWRKSLHDRIGFLDETLLINSDYDWKMRCFLNASCLMVPDVTIDYRIHKGQHSVVSRDTGERRDNDFRVREKFREQFKRILG